MSDRQRQMSLVLTVFLSTNIDDEKINVSNKNRGNETNLMRNVVGKIKTNTTNLLGKEITKKKKQL